MEAVPAPTGESGTKTWNDVVPSFVHVSHPRRVVFGVGALAGIAQEVAALGCERVVVVTGGAAREVGAGVAGLLGSRCVSVLDEVRQHVPEDLAAAAVEEVKGVGGDGLCSVGGGSATGLAKAVAVELDLPIVAVPTTYAGSEMTPVWGITGEHKRTGRDARAAPRAVVYDPEITIGLPPRVSAASGLNALAHAVGALLSGRDPVASLHAAEAIRMLAAALPEVVSTPGDLPARTRVQFGAYLAASALEAGDLAGIHHPLCHILGGTYRLIHADVHAVLLPHTLAYEQQRNPEGAARVRAAVEAADPALMVWELARRVGAPAGLAEVGLPAGATAEAAARAAEGLGVDAGRIRRLLDDAHRGGPPPAETEEQKGAAS